MVDSSTENSLGLDFNNLNLNQSSSDTVSAQPPSADSEEQPPTAAVQSPTSEQDLNTSDHAPTDAKERKKPYVNPERVKTGGSQRDKLSEEELAERMERIRQQNEKIKQRRLDVQADEDAFRKTQEVERAKLVQNRKVQESVDRAREQNAKRKMDKIQSREWDSGKPSPTEWKNRKNTSQTQPKEVNEKEGTENEETAGSESGQWTRGGRGSQRSRGRGRGGGGGRRRGRGEGPETSPEPAAQPSSTDSISLETSS